MTLKEYFTENEIEATPDERSKLGRVISRENDSNGYLIEDGRSVKDYKETFLKSHNTTVRIINFFKANYGRG